MHNFLEEVFKQEDYTLEVQNFNLVQAIYFFGLLFMCGVIYVAIPDPFYLYLSIIMCFFIAVSIIDANRTGEHTKCACIVSLLSNLLYLPMCFYGFGKLICCVPIYFILGILYTVLLVNGKAGVLLSIAETVYMGIMIVHLGGQLPSFYAINPTTIDYFSIVFAIVIVSILASVSIMTKVKQYDTEFKRMQEARVEVREAYNSKDIFFANTSHEIRTPLNAIVGTVNLLLNEDLDIQVKENVYNILNSCNALLSIIDELMELSNTGNNDVSIVDSKYDFSEMILEISNMMAVRLIESSVDLFVEIDKDVPRYLWGDGGKVRQLFINILNNAVKYTKEGKITLRVHSKYIDDSVWDLIVEVEDTGIGITKEVIPKLFSDYNRDEEDAEKRSIEGTGLGLSLCKELVKKMHGDISVESEYHVGSTFKFNVHQKVYEIANIVRFNNKDDKSSIIFERNEEFANALYNDLRTMGIDAVIVNDRLEFESSIMEGKYSYVFIANERYMENQRFIDRKLDNYRIIIISDLAQSIHPNRNCYLLSRPLNIINIVKAFNNEVSSFGREVIKKGSFTLPDTTILVVDDNITNLEVASGLLKKYNATIITAISGVECLNIVDHMKVDIVFLDYMMPEMNGIDTFRAMRKLESETAKNVPVIALTANVASGAREMFIDEGFCDYISKPIDVNKLENVLMKYIPRDQIKVQN